MASLEIDLFWSFRSPYSYLATPRLPGAGHALDFDAPEAAARL